MLNHKFKAEEEMTLEQLESLNVFSYPQELMEISGQASSEAGLEALLRKANLTGKNRLIQLVEIINICRWKKLGKGWSTS